MRTVMLWNNVPVRVTGLLIAGAKQSSYGPREQGLAARGFCTETRTITIVP